NIHFESLAIVLILDIFEYFNAIQLLHTINGLNSRLNELIYLRLQTYPLDFRSISKQDFDRICQKKLPFVTNQIKSIHLSNDDDTPQQPNLINNIISECPHLVDLNISKSQLKYCYLDIPIFNEFYIPLSTIISSSLEKLSIANDLFNIDDFIRLFQHTPNLQNLDLRIQETSNNDQFPCSLETLTNLLKSMPNLSELIIETDGIYITGYQWEQRIIINLHSHHNFHFNFQIFIILNYHFHFDDVLWSVIPKFDRLVTIEFVSIIHPDETDRPITDLHQLLDRAQHIHSITMDYLIISQLALVKFKNKSIRRLDLIANDGHFYVLLINIENRSIVVDLIENMPNLRALTFQCQDDRWGDTNEALLIEDEFVQWLKNRLPSHCLVIRDENELSAIQLWFR
ncbi:unnamed protein product, partial [Rotaria magnacalcarata]